MTKSRTNIKFIPSSDTLTNLVKLLDDHNIPHEDLVEDPHCTIVYSSDIVDISTIVLPEIKYPVVGLNPKFELLDTKDNGICLVVIFDCLFAETLFFEIKRKHNLRTLFDSYIPHITIKKNLPDSHLNLPEIYFEIYLDKLKMDNGD